MVELCQYVATPNTFDSTEVRINEMFNRLIECLTRRRIELLTMLKQTWEKKRNTTKSRSAKLQQLINMKADIEKQKLEESLRYIQTNMLEEVNTNIRNSQLEESRDTQIVFEYSTKQLEDAVSVLGEFVEKDVTVPNYRTLVQPSISVGKEGTAEGELKWPGGLAFDEKSQLIFVGNGGCAGIGKGRISVFTIKGEYVSSFCDGLFNEPGGIAVYGNEIFISDTYLHSIFKLKLSSFELIKKIGSNGVGVGEFNCPQKLSLTTDGTVYVADCGNNRVVVLSNELKHRQHITHHTMKFPCDVKVNENKMYILSFTDDPCLHVFSLSGELMYSFISCGITRNTQVKQSYSFCFDKKQNIIFGDHAAKNIKVFSQTGKLLHVVGDRNARAMKMNPTSILVTENSNIVCVSSNSKLALHIF